MATKSVAVVGAGPAGATAARVLAERGVDVTCYEARRFPRQKPCGGGLTPKSLKLIPDRVRQASVARISETEIRSRHMPVFVASSTRSTITMVDRSAFDYALLDCAAQAGAVIREDARVQDIAETDGGVAVATSKHRDVYDAVVVADGANSACARALGLPTVAHRRSLALEFDSPPPPHRADDLARLSFDVPGGYAWYFPKGDHANLGVGAKYPLNAPTQFAGTLKQHLRSFARGLSIDFDERLVRGHWIPYGLRPEPLATPRIVLAGDAAGTADPLLCEGISFAIVSGIVAAGTIIDVDAGRLADLRPYDGRLRRLLGPAFRRLGLAANLAHRAPTLSLFAYRLSGWVQRYADDVIAGDSRPFAFEVDDTPRIVSLARTA